MNSPSKSNSVHEDIAASCLVGFMMGILLPCFFLFECLGKRQDEIDAAKGYESYIDQTSEKVAAVERANAHIPAQFHHHLVGARTAVMQIMAEAKMPGPSWQKNCYEFGFFGSAFLLMMCTFVLAGYFQGEMSALEMMRK